MRAPLRALTLAALAGGAAFGYASIVERNWFALRRADVPVLPAGSEPVRVTVQAARWKAAEQDTAGTAG